MYTQEVYAKMIMQQSDIIQIPYIDSYNIRTSSELIII